MTMTFKAILLASVFGGFAAQALAADLPDTTPAPGVVVDSSHGWDGAYVGGFIGYGIGTADQTGPNPPLGPYPTDGVDVSLAGATLGVTVGGNTHVGDGIVVGAALDLAWSNMGGTYTSSTFPGDLYSGTTHTINWTGAARGVLGFDGGAFMPYLTAGLAVANATRVSGFGAPPHLTANDTQVGWTAGAGVQVALGDNASIDVRYLYSDYGTGGYNWANNPGVQNPEIGLTTQTVTVGLNWRF